MVAKQTLAITERIQTTNNITAGAPSYHTDRELSCLSGSSATFGPRVAFGVGELVGTVLGDIVCVGTAVGTAVGAAVGHTSEHKAPQNLHHTIKHPRRE